MVAKTFASEHDVNSGRANPINVMQNYYRLDPTQPIPASQEKLERTNHRNQIDTLNDDIEFLNELAESAHKRKEIEKQDMDEIKMITTESFLKNDSAENNTGFATPLQFPSEKGVFNKFK